MPRNFVFKARDIPVDDDGCGWAMEGSGPPLGRRLAGERRVGSAVVGAGFTGIAAARRLAELRPGEEVAVLEAQRVGQGTAGRSSGFVVDLADLTAGMTPEDRARHVRVARSGIDDLRRLVHAHDIDCDWDDTGWLRGAASDEGERFLDQWPPMFEAAGIEPQWLDEHQLARIMGTTFYRRGVRLPGYPMVQGAALVQGLARSLPEGVSLFEETPVRRIQGGPPYRLEAGAGSVRADRVFVATNGYTPALGLLARRIVPIYSFGALTRMLTEDEQAALGGEREWGLLAMDPMGSSLRRLRDQRILVRNTIHYSAAPRLADSVRERVTPALSEALTKRFPALAGIELEHVWSGLFATTWNRQPVFGEVEKGLYSAACYTGAGIAMGTALGRLLADQALGEPSSLLDDMLALPTPTLLPPDPFRGWGIRWTYARMNRRATHV